MMTISSPLAEPVKTPPLMRAGGVADQPAAQERERARAGHRDALPYRVRFNVLNDAAEARALCAPLGETFRVLAGPSARLGRRRCRRYRP